MTIRMKLALAIMALMFAAGEAAAQQNPGATHVPKPKSQRDAIQQQKRGQYPAFNRGATLPKGAINYNWATHCKPDQSTVNFLYKPGTEIRVRVRQLIGTVLRFPEEVAAITSGLGNAITLSAYPKKEARSSQLWVLGSRVAGLDGNIAFIGGADVAGQRIYSLRVQTEGVNTNNCPDLVVNIRSNTDASIDAVAARIARSLGGEGTAAPAPAAVPTVPVFPGDAVPPPSEAASNETAAGTGRREVDWLEGFTFDPSKLDFQWSMGGDGDAQSFAPDAVFSDDEFMYLHWRPDRMKRMILPSISAVIPTDRGKVDGPVSWVRRGNMVIVQRITDLTLEFEGLVVCITRDHADKEGS